MRLRERIREVFLRPPDFLAQRWMACASLACSLMLFACPLAKIHGATVIWVGNTSNVLNTNSNWNPSGSPSNDDTQFGAPGTSGNTLALTGNLTLNSITFTSGANSTNYVLSGSFTLTINAGITNSSTALQTDQYANHPRSRADMACKQWRYPHRRRKSTTTANCLQ